MNYRSILKVGFQTDRDRARFLFFVEKHVARARIEYDKNVDIYSVTSGTEVYIYFEHIYRFDLQFIAIYMLTWRISGVN